MWLNKKELTSIVFDVINRYLIFILNKLGYKDKPENLSLKISDTYDHALGICFAFFKDYEKTNLAEAVIVLYPSNIIWLKILDWLWLPRLCMFSRKLLEKRILYVLAHELRHFWQYHTGTHKKQRKSLRFLSFGYDSMEADAEKWAQEFLSIYWSKPRISGLSF